MVGLRSQGVSPARGTSLDRRAISDKPEAQVLVLRYSGHRLSRRSVLLGETVADDPFQRADPPGGLEAIGDVLQLALLTGQADRLAQPVGPLALPPSPPLVAQVAAGQLLHPVPFQVEERRHRQLRPALHRRERPESVLHAGRITRAPSPAPSMPARIPARSSPGEPVVPAQDLIFGRGLVIEDAHGEAPLT